MRTCALCDTSGSVAALARPSMHSRHAQPPKGPQPQQAPPWAYAQNPPRPRPQANPFTSFAQTSSSPRTWGDVVTDCQRHAAGLSAREQEFLASMVAWRHPTTKQGAWLRAIVTRLGVRPWTGAP